MQTTAFVLTAGADVLKKYESSAGKFRHFCETCGSPIYSSRQSRPDVVRVRAGLISGKIATRPGSHAHVDSKCEWWSINDDIPQFPAAYVESQK
ncbi:MAG: hypothetical protein ACI802_001114 [Candidatus Paceibacteria bacterium]